MTNNFRKGNNAIILIRQNIAFIIKDFVFNMRRLFTSLPLFHLLTFFLLLSPRDCVAIQQGVAIYKLTEID